MAYQKVSTGNAANDGTGDDLRTGAGKINANIEEIYGKINGVGTINNGAAITSDTVVLLAATQTLTNKTLTSPTITGTGAIAAASVTTSNHFQAAVYADTTARDAAITNPAAGMVAYLTATNKLQVYNGSAWQTITSS